MKEYIIPIINKPRLLKDGDIAYFFPKSLLDRSDERIVSIQLILNRKLFGLCYSALMFETFNFLQDGNGVLISAFIPSQEISPNLKSPGDIDLLVIPYQNNELLISRTLVVEIKIVRATFLKQGKSPNEFGFSQAKKLLQNGFPYVALGHLIISDKSPEDERKKLLQGTIANSKTGALKDLKEVYVDMLPIDLIDRCFGRLLSNCASSSLGLFSAYISEKGELCQNGIYFPTGRLATYNTSATLKMFHSIANYYENNYYKFLDTPRY